jgi:catechol 2,3-dioxygenase-like lactoylglutathione lyase family enzyme
MSQPRPSQNWRLGRLHHVGLTVADIERSIRFYRDILGLTLHRRRPHVDSDYVAQQTGHAGVVLSVASFSIPGSPQTLEIVQYLTHAAAPAVPATNQPGISHVCLLVDNLSAAYEDLQARGVPFRSEPVRITAGPNAGGLVVYLADPDGYTLELFQPPEA